MAEFQEVMKIMQRMCENNNCDECPLGSVNNGLDVVCSIGLLKKYPQQAEEIIMKWAKENPVQTNADKFQEVFGYNIDPGCHRLEDCDGDCKKCELNDFWKQEYKPKGEDE